MDEAIDHNTKSAVIDYNRDKGAQEDVYLTFEVGDEEYAIEIGFVTEIIGLQKIVKVPGMPDFVRGMINLRGAVIPLVDVKTRFGFDDEEYTERTCIVVARINGNSVGFIVDAVCDVIDIPESNIDSVPDMNGGQRDRYVKGFGKIGEKMVILLIAHKLLFDDELAEIEASVN